MTATAAWKRECDVAIQRPAHVNLGPWSSVRVRRLSLRKPCAGDSASAQTSAPGAKRAAAVAPGRVREFQALVQQWKRETAIAGHLSKIVIHPAYQRIMAMGPQDAIPLILQELSRSPGHWFWALHNLVPAGADPAHGTTTIGDATRAWLEWGKREGYL